MSTLSYHGAAHLINYHTFSPVHPGAFYIYLFRDWSVWIVSCIGRWTGAGYLEKLWKDSAAVSWWCRREQGHYQQKCEDFQQHVHCAYHYQIVYLVFFFTKWILSMYTVYYMSGLSVGRLGPSHFPTFGLVKLTCRVNSYRPRHIQQ